MNIGGYKPDGNIMTVPEIKEIVTEGVDISDLKDKVDTIQGNVTALQEAISDTNETLSSTITDLNNTKGNVETLTTAVNTLDTELSETSESVATNTEDIATNATDIEGLQGTIQSLTSELNNLKEDTIITSSLSLINPVFYGYCVGDGKSYNRYCIPKNMDSTKQYTVDLTELTGMTVRGGGVVINYNTNAGILAIIDSVFIRNGHINVHLKSISTLVPHTAICINFVGNIKIVANT